MVDFRKPDDPAPDPWAGPASQGPVYGTPQPEYGMPQPDYGMPEYGTPQPDYGMPVPPAYPSTYPPGYPAAVGYGGYVDPYAPFGRDPMTGQPFSDKSKTTAGLLQMLLGFVSVPGIGRLYLGHTGIGLAQLLGFWVGVATTFLLVGFFIFPAIWIWAFVDGILMLAGNVRDPQGRPLRS